MQKPDRLSLAISIFAFLVSLGAFVVSIWSEEQTRLYNHLSLTPILQFERSSFPYSPRTQMGLFLGNYGSGTAIVQSYTIFVDGKPIKQNKDGPIVETVKELGIYSNPDLPLIMQNGLRQAVAPGDSYLVFGFNGENYTYQRGVTLYAALCRMSLHVEYKSLYNDTYTADLQQCP